MSMVTITPKFKSRQVKQINITDGGVILIDLYCNTVVTEFDLTIDELEQLIIDVKEAQLKMIITKG